MKDTAKVCILMPVYNTKTKYLRDAINSILSQTYPNFEFVILNDGSTDHACNETILSYSDKRIKYISNKINKGLGSVRNSLLEYALKSECKYIAIMDSDDISLPKRIEKEVIYLEDNPEIDIVSANIKLFPKKNRNSDYESENKRIKEKMLFGECEIANPCVMFRKDIFSNKNIKYEEEFSGAEDYALWLNFLPYVNFANLPEILLKYRLYNQNTIH